MDNQALSEAVAAAVKQFGEADKLLEAGEFLSASQAYAECARVLEAAHPEMQHLASGYHHLARSLEAYFDDRIVEAIRFAQSASELLTKAKAGDRAELAESLSLAFQSYEATLQDDHRSAEALLDTAIERFTNLRSKCAELSGSCAFWIEWSRFRFLFHLLIDESFDEPSRAKDTLETLAESCRTLKSIAATQAASHYYDSHLIWARGLRYFGEAADAQGDYEFDKQLQLLESAQKQLTLACATWEKLQLPAGASDLDVHLLYLAGSADSARYQVEAEKHAFAGNRQASILACKRGLEVVGAMLKNPRLESEYPDIEEDISDLKEFLGKVSRGDPEVLDLEPKIRKVCAGQLAEEVLANLRELTNCVIQGNVLSALVLCGGALEALVMAYLEGRKGDAMKASAAPKKDGATIPLFHWELADLLKVAGEIKAFPAGMIQLTHGLREFRNYIHPGKRLREGYTLIGEEVASSVATLKMVVNHLAK